MWIFLPSLNSHSNFQKNRCCLRYLHLFSSANFFIIFSTCRKLTWNAYFLSALITQHIVIKTKRNTKQVRDLWIVVLLFLLTNDSYFHVMSWCVIWANRDYIQISRVHLTKNCITSGRSTNMHEILIFSFKSKRKKKQHKNDIMMM